MSSWQRYHNCPPTQLVQANQILPEAYFWRIALFKEELKMASFFSAHSCSSEPTLSQQWCRFGQRKTYRHPLLPRDIYLPFLWIVLRFRSRFLRLTLCFENYLCKHLQVRAFSQLTYHAILQKLLKANCWQGIAGPPNFHVTEFEGFQPGAKTKNWTWPWWLGFTCLEVSKAWREILLRNFANLWNPKTNNEAET